MTDNPQDRASALERGVAELARRVRRGRETVEGAVQDELTGPMSRRRMHEGIDLALTALRDGGDPSAVLLIDIGSSEPESLAIAAEIMAAALRPDDLVGHYGDDVFVIVARDVADEDSAHKVAARLTRMLVGPLGGEDAGARIKIGLSVVRAEDPTAGAVVARADAAMYSARNRASRDRRSDAEQYAARNKASREAHAGEQRLAPDAGRDALVEAAFDCSSIEDFDVYYQPIADLGCGSVAGVEAILHWEHPDLGTIEPSEFLPIAERRGQMVTLGRREGRPMRTAVHVSPSQVADPAFLEDLEAALAHSGATGQQLALDLTEETLAGISAELAEALAYARIALVLDHSAAHTPSPERVASLPIAVIRLDASSAQGVAAPDLREAAELVRSLDLPTVVDGIATREQLGALLGYGFPLGQGELFARPQSAAAIEALVHRERPFASLLAPSRSMAATLAFDRDEPLVEVGAPAVP
jgi:diguanylate cyclase (GGDEF)-like protein